ncbi:MAG: hypothetical protein H8E68_02240 [Kiritimatiellaeota bacterium]|nr:hypothetical protein [Kiritimatiellota bacterium]
MKRNIIFLGLCSLLFGCATPYQPVGSAGGYFHKRLAENVYSITFKGNGFSSYKQVYNYTLLRACEIGDELGYTHMVIEGQDDCTRTTTVDMGANSYTTGSAYG